MTVVSNASPLIAFARIGHFDLLPHLYPRVIVSTDVFNEVVIAGAAMPGAKSVAQADWIEVRPLSDDRALALALAETGLGAGELSAIFLAKEIGAAIVLLMNGGLGATPSRRDCR